MLSIIVKQKETDGSFLKCLINKYMKSMVYIYIQSLLILRSHVISK